MSDDDLVHAMEVCMFESHDSLINQHTGTQRRLHYARALLRHFDIKPKPGHGYPPRHL